MEKKEREKKRERERTIYDTAVYTRILSVYMIISRIHSRTAAGMQAVQSADHRQRGEPERALGNKSHGGR